MTDQGLRAWLNPTVGQPLGSPSRESHASLGDQGVPPARRTDTQRAPGRDDRPLAALEERVPRLFIDSGVPRGRLRLSYYACAGEALKGAGHARRASVFSSYYTRGAG